MSMVQGTQSGTPAADLSALLQLAATQQGSTKALDVKDLEESLNALRSFLAAGGDSLLPDLEEPSSKSSTTVSLSGLTMSGLSLETLLDAVGFEQRRTETKAGMASLEARAQERAMANDEKLKSIQEQLEKAKSQSFLDGLLKAFKYIGMALAAIGSVAMIAAGSVGLAAGGSGAALIAVGAASLALLTSSIMEEASGGKAGFSLSFITGKIMEACGADTAIQWTKFAVDLATTIALTALTFGAGAAGAAGKVAQTATKTVSDTAQTFQKAASWTARVATMAGGANTIAQSATSIASAVNEKDISYLQAQQKHLQAILERIAMANELDLEHLKEVMRRSEQTLQTVSDSVQANVAILSGNPAMA